MNYQQNNIDISVNSLSALSKIMVFEMSLSNWIESEVIVTYFTHFKSIYKSFWDHSTPDSDFR